MSTPTLKKTALLEISHDDLCAIIGEHYCSSSYGAFAKTTVQSVSENVDGGTFTIEFAPSTEVES